MSKAVTIMQKTTTHPFQLKKIPWELQNNGLLYAHFRTETSIMSLHTATNLTSLNPIYILKLWPQILSIWILNCCLNLYQLWANQQVHTATLYKSTIQPKPRMSIWFLIQNRRFNRNNYKSSSFKGFKQSSLLPPKKEASMALSIRASRLKDFKLSSLFPIQKRNLYNND